MSRVREHRDVNFFVKVLETWQRLGDKLLCRDWSFVVVLKAVGVVFSLQVHFGHHGYPAAYHRHRTGGSHAGGRVSAALPPECFTVQTNQNFVSGCQSQHNSNFAGRRGGTTIN